jgi:hypothetical protein
MLYDPYNLDTFPERGFVTTGYQGDIPRNSRPFLSESEKLHYETNKRFFSEKYWKYADPSFIDYTTNNDGFRCDTEFDDVDWANTSVVVGCSFVHGHCAENENTISEILTHEYGTPFVNGGIPGAGNRTIHYNAITFMKKYKPKKVIIIWSFPSRYLWFTIVNDRWEANHIMPSTPITRTERKSGIIDKKIPSAYYDLECHDSIYDWSASRDIHDLLGNKQYNNCDRFATSRTEDEKNWMHRKDSTLYDKYMTYIGPDRIRITPEDLQKPEIYELINSYFARDVSYNPADQSLELRHFGAQINRDIADLIYRDNFK